MGYVFQNIHGVLTVRDESTLNEPKQIRFIDPHYNEKFKIADGEQILVCFADGKRKAFFCQYLDDAHVLVGRNAYHICEFAERMERIGACVEPFPEKHIIWSDIHLDLKDWIADLREEYPDLDEAGLTEKMYELNSEYLADERVNLDIVCGEIIAFGDIGLWHGRVDGYKIIESGNIKDCLYTQCEMAEWYVDREGEFRSKEIHHDGTNYIRYRKWKDDVSYDDREDFLERVYNGTVTQGDIDKHTEKLGQIIGDVYGWKFPTPTQERESVRDSR